LTKLCNDELPSV